DITLRWPWRLRADEQAILNIPVDVLGHQVAAGGATITPTPTTGSSAGLSPIGTSQAMPVPTGSGLDPPAVFAAVPRRRLGALVPPRNAQRTPDETGAFRKPGASTTYREQGQRLIAIKFAVRGRDLAGTVAEAKKQVEPLLQPPYRAEWSGEFQEMEEAEG